MDSNPICQPSPTNKMKCSFLEYVQLLMISLAGLWTQTPSASPLQPKKWNATFWITFNFWWLAGLVNGLKPHPPPLSSQRNERLIFLLCSTSNDQPGLSMDLNPIHNLSPAQKMKCSFLDYVQTSDDWLSCLIDLNPIHHPSPPKNMKCLSLYNIQHLMLARLVNGLKPHLPPSLAKKWNVHFWIMFNFWWLAGLVDGLKPHPPPLSSQKREMLIFGLHSTSDNQTGWSMDSNPIHHPSPAKNVKCSFLDYIQLLIISRAGQWTRTPSTTPLHPKTWNACLCITFNIWCWPDWSMTRTPSTTPLQPKNEMLIFGLCSTSDNWNGWLMDSNPICQPSPAHKNEMLLLDYVQLLMIGLAGWWTWTPSASLCSQKNEMLLFGLRSTSDDWLGWSMDSNPILHLSPAKEMKCSFLYYVQLLMISQACRWTWTPSTTCLQPKNWNAHILIMFNFWWLAGLVNGLKPHPPLLSSQKKWNACFCITFNFWCWPGWSMDLNPICHPSPAKKMKCSFLDYIQLLMIGRAGWWTQTPSTTTLQSKNEILIFGLRSTSDDQLGWSMDSNPICHPSPAKKMKCSFLDYVQLPIIGLAGRWTQTPSASPLQLIKWNAHFWNMFNWHGLTDPHLPALSSWFVDSNPICQPSPAKKMKCYFLDYVQLLMIGWASQWTQTPSSTSLQPKKWNAHFSIMFNF